MLWFVCSLWKLCKTWELHALSLYYSSHWISELSQLELYEWDPSYFHSAQLLCMCCMMMRWEMKTKSVVKLIFYIFISSLSSFHARDSFHFYLLLPLCFIYYRWESLSLFLAWKALIRKHYYKPEQFIFSFSS